MNHLTETIAIFYMPLWILTSNLHISKWLTLRPQVTLLRGKISSDPEIRKVYE